MKLIYVYTFFLTAVLLYPFIQFNTEQNRFLSVILLYQATIVLSGFFILHVIIRTEASTGLKIWSYAIIIPIVCFFFTALFMNLRIHRRLCPSDIYDFDQFYVVTEDNVSISGIVKAGNHDRAVIIVHGVAANKTDCQLLALANKLAGQFDVYLFDFRGYGQSKGESTFGNLEIMDLRAVVDYAYQHRYSSISLIGNSMGGMISVRLTAEDKKVNALVLAGTPASFLDPKSDEAKNLSLILSNPLGRKIYQIFTQIPVSELVTALSPDEKMLISPINLIDKLSSIPVFIIHGENDRSVSVENAHMLFSRARQPKDLILYKNGGHGITDLSREFGDTFRQTLLDWLIKHTK